MAWRARKIQNSSLSSDRMIPGDGVECAFAKSASEQSGVYRQAGAGDVSLRKGRRIVSALQDG